MTDRDQDDERGLASASLPRRLTMNPVFRERLYELRKLMLSLPEERVELSSWRAFKNEDSREHMPSDAELLSCNALACAAGWACAHPPFKAEGLTFQDDLPTYKGYRHFYALEEFFGTGTSCLFWQYSDYIPVGASDLSARDLVVARIDEFLESCNESLP